MIPDRRAFIRANTRLKPVPLVREISLYVADESVPLWLKTEEELNEAGLPPPYWAFAWAGGQALARYVLDNPECVTGKRTLDLHAAIGTRVLIGDPGRTYLPKDRLTRLAEYSVPVTRELEDLDIKRTAVWELCPLSAKRGEGGEPEG